VRILHLKGGVSYAEDRKNGSTYRSQDCAAHIAQNRQAQVER